MYRFILLDLDDTLLDFHRAERVSLSAALKRFGLPCTPEVIRAYSQINLSWWQRLERGEIPREAVFPGRFRDLLTLLGSGADPEEVGELYEKGLESCPFVLPGAYAALRSLRRQGRRLYAASNGSVKVQRARLRLSGLDRLLNGVFISEELGQEKPGKGFFLEVFRRIPEFDPEQCLMAGDSLTSDVLGAVRAGLCAVWVRKSGASPIEGIRPHHTVSSAAELPALLERLEGRGRKEH